MDFNFEINTDFDFDFKKAKEKTNKISYEKTDVSQFHEIVLNEKTRMYKSIEKLNEYLEIPPKDCFSFFIATAEFSNIALFSKLLENYKGKFDSIYCFIFTTNDVNAKILNDLLERSENSNLCVCRIMNTERDQELCVIDKFSAKAKKVFVNSHCKILAAKFEDKYLVVEGSGNTGRNAKIEQYSIFNNKKVFEVVEKSYNHIYKNYGFKSKSKIFNPDYERF